MNCSRKFEKAFIFISMRKNGNQVLPGSRLRCFGERCPEVSTNWSGAAVQVSKHNLRGKFNW